jgi:23S rRNA pseudouridine2457 synthase
MLQRKKENIVHTDGAASTTWSMRLVLVNKPFRVLPQFTDREGRATLRDYVSLRGVYPAGRLDYDSEGLMALTDCGAWQARIASPRSSCTKSYVVQVEGAATPAAVGRLKTGVDLADGPACALRAELIDEPRSLWPRHPPIRYRRAIPTSWLRLSLDEGRNRQVRRMTAAVGLPALRLIRWSIGPWDVGGLAPGEWRIVPFDEVVRTLGEPPARRDTLKRSARTRRSASRARGTARS